MDEDRTFFCSELVAKMYKVLGILDSEEPSSSFFPGNFSAKKKLPLKPGSQLGPEYFIKPNELTEEEKKQIAFSKSLQKK